MNAPVSPAGKPTPKAFRHGTDRTLEPRQTLAKLTPFLDDFGITRVADVTGMDCIGIPTVMVVRPNSRSISVSQGKGIDLVTAKVSGIMESIEQFHAERIHLPLLLGSYAEVGALGQMAEVERMGAFVRAFNRSQRILWISGKDFVSGAATWVPFETVHLDLRLPLPPGSGYFLSGSNGLASGNHPLEAISHGLCELIERDALSLFLQSDARYQTDRRLNIETVDDAACRELLDIYARANIDVAVWDITSDLDIPCFLCWILEKNPDVFRPVGLAQGAGCHPSRAIALSRALTEAAQSRVTRIVGSRDDIQPQHLTELRSADQVQVYRNQMANTGRDARHFQSAPSHTFETFEEDVSLLVERIQAAGVRQVIGVDLSRAEYPVHVWRMLAPGMEGPAYMPGYRPGKRAAEHRTRLLKGRDA